MNYVMKRIAHVTLATARKNGIVSVLAIAVTLGFRSYSAPIGIVPPRAPSPAAKFNALTGRELILSGPKADLDRLRARFPLGKSAATRLVPLFSASERAFLVAASRKHAKPALARDSESLVYSIPAESRVAGHAESEDTQRLRTFIHAQRLGITLEENEPVRPPAPAARQSLNTSLNASTATSDIGHAFRGAAAFLSNVIATPNDDFSDQQWYLTGSNITLRRDAADVLDQPEYVKGVPGMDIRLNTTRLGGTGPSNEGAGITVGVLDSGLDLTHPDFVDADGTSRIVRNPDECTLFADYANCTRTRGKRACDLQYLLPVNDKDGDGYPLDCSGWSSVESGLGSPIVTDSIAHGTHVAGIIAASKNGFGVTGVAPRAKILPIRVISEDPSGDNETTRRTLSGVAVVSQVIRGMTYAIKNHVNVINLSLGWNGRSDSQMMHDLVQLAEKEGILVVAAAGNDGTNALVFPCAYSEVICVGAHRNDGKRLDFSNFGNGVDLSAPGMSILSTIPAGIDAEIFTAKRGYDYKDGTSMATPIVAGSIARLLSDGVPVSEVKARLYLGATRSQAPEGTEVLSGLLNVSGALTIPLQPFFTPTTKGVYPAILRRGSNDFAIHFEVTNVGSATTAPIAVSVALRDAEALGSQVKLLTPSALLPMTANGAKVGLDLNLTSLTDRIPSEIELLVTLKTGSRSQTLLVPILLSTFLTAAAPPERTARIPVKNSDAMIKDAVLFSIKSLDGSPLQDYLAFHAEDEKTITFQILREQRDSAAGRSYVAGPAKAVHFDRIVSPRSIQRLDVDLDGKSEYFISFYSPPDEDTHEEIQSFFISYWNENIEEVLPSFLFSGVKKPSSIFRLDAYQWIRANVAGKPRLVPAWIDQAAPVAKIELDAAYDPVLNPAPEFALASRIYYHDPSAGDEGLRTIPQRGFHGKTPVRFFDFVQLGTVSVLFSNATDDEASTGYASATLTEAKLPNLSFTPLTLSPPRDLRTSRTDFSFIPLTELDRSETAGVQKNMGTPAQTLSLVRKEGTSSRLQELQFPVTFPQDFIFKGMAGFYDRTRIAAFAMGVYDIYYKDSTTVNASDTNPALRTSLRRYTFLPSEIFDRQFFAASIDDAGTPMPGLRIPDGFGAYPGSEIIVPERDRTTGVSKRLSRPAYFRYLVGDACQEMSPLPATARDPYTAVYFCGNQFLQIPYRY